MFSTQNGMFFLEISALEKKNLELLQKVMRIRSSHLIKKNNQNKLISEKESPKNMDKSSNEISLNENEPTITKNSFPIEINTSRPELPSRISSEKLDLSLFSNVILF